MTVVRHVVIGPERHGVVLHALEVARACRHDVVRASTARDIRSDDLRGASVVHVAFADRLFGSSIESAVNTMITLAALVDECGAGLSMTLHDVPHDDSPLQARRALGYRQVISLAAGVVVNSQVELRALGAVPHDLASVTCIPLPVPAPVHAARPDRRVGAPRSVGVLGFIYPDRGYEEVLAALPRGSELVAIGQPSAGHEGLEQVLAREGEKCGVGWRMTGFVPESDLAGVLAGVDVAVAPNRRVTASASVITWTTHGRQVLAPDSPHMREVATAWPAAVRLYDPDDPGALRSMLQVAFDDPSTTWLSADDVPRSSLEETASRYSAHLTRCAPRAAIILRSGRATVPGNRWDLLDSFPDDPSATVSVVIPYYETQDQLDRLLAALDAQTYDHTRMEVVVADDGSSTTPDVGAAGKVEARVVRQADRGFRAAAARNLGAAAAEGTVVAFLDADMVPEPDYLRLLCRLPSIGPDCLTVGRRRHAGLTGWSTAATLEWFQGGRGPVVLDEPQWLAAGYESSRDLLDVDSRSYRYMISAVLALDRGLLGELAGFDESFVEYGGEDWEFAHRAYVAGAVFAHVPAAVAWHEGADWAGRVDEVTRRRVKNAEQARLGQLLPDPVARAAAVPASTNTRPAVIVELSALDASGAARCVASAIAAGVDCGFWHSDARVVAALDDAAVVVGSPSDEVAASAGFTAQVDCPTDLGSLWEWCLEADRVGVVRAGRVQVSSRRLLNRARRHRGAQLTDLMPRIMGFRDLPT